MFSNSILVVAHPDDEILWFSSVLDKIGATLICFLASPEGSFVADNRSEAISRLPLSNISCLGLDEAGSFGGADWNDPKTMRYGLKLTKKPKAKKKYKENFRDLYTALDKKLRGHENVFTHNPWGEYGHEDHILVYRVVEALQKKHGFKLWVSCYCSPRSARLMARLSFDLPPRYEILRTNLELAKEVMSLYKEASCWTWVSDADWFPSEALICIAPAMQGAGMKNNSGLLFPINMLDFKFISQPFRDRICSSIRKILLRLKRKVLSPSIGVD